MHTGLFKNLRRNKRGSVMVELALTAPLALILAVGVTDFARLLYHAVTIRGASSIAAFYGAQDDFKSTDTASLTARAESDAANLGADVAAQPELVCQCPGAAPFACEDYSTTTCTGYGKARLYVRVGVSQPFETLADYIKIPDNVQISETTLMRVR